jgi:hypothetical protein
VLFGFICEEVSLVSFVSVLSDEDVWLETPSGVTRTRTACVGDAVALLRHRIPNGFQA